MSDCNHINLIKQVGPIDGGPAASTRYRCQNPECGTFVVTKPYEVTVEYGPSPSGGELALTFVGFSAINRQRCESKDGFNHALNSWSTSDWFLALLGELGEAANVAKKLNRYRDGIPGNKQSKEDLEVMLRAELGDSFVYLDLLAQSLGVQIGEVAREVFNAKSEQLGCRIRMAGGELAQQGVEIDLMQVADARVWAKEFVRIAQCVHPVRPLSDDDIDWMQSWFASAITVGEMMERKRKAGGELALREARIEELKAVAHKLSMHPYCAPAGIYIRERIAELLAAAPPSGDAHPKETK